MENETIKDVDWRSKVVTTLKESSKLPNGRILKKGTPVKLCTLVKIGESEFGFPEPSASALFLNQSFMHYRKSLELHPKKINPKLNCIDLSSIYDYLESICASIIFSFLSLEAYANEEIPEDFVVDSSKISAKVPNEANQIGKQIIERYLPLSDKIDKVLPEVFEKKSPKGTKIWEDFIYLRKIRNRIIHLKSKDRIKSTIYAKYPKTIWSDLLSPEQKEYPNIAKSIIFYFGSNTSNHWLNFIPF